MKPVYLRMTVLSIVFVIAAASLTGCGIPVKLSETVDLVKDIKVPAMPEADVAEIPEEFRQYVDNWEDYEEIEDFLNTPFDYQRAEEFCDLPDLDKIRAEAASRLPGFLARRIEVRSVSVRSIRFIAETGDFDSVDELQNVLTLEGKEYVFSITNEDGLGPVISLAPSPELDLADLINNPEFDGCIQNKLDIVGTLPEQEIIFKALLDLDIKLYLRIL